jgi:hypothetical protein
VIVEMTKTYQRVGAAVLDVTRAREEGDDGAEPTQDVGGIENTGQLRRRLDPVLQWYYQCVGSDHGQHGARGRGDLPGFDATQNVVDDADLGGVVAGLDPVDNEITGNAADLESLRTHYREVFVARYKGDILADLRQSSAEVCANTTTAIYRYSHPVSHSSRL